MCSSCTKFKTVSNGGKNDAKGYIAWLDSVPNVKTKIHYADSIRDVYVIGFEDLKSPIFVVYSNLGKLNVVRAILRPDGNDYSFKYFYDKSSAAKPDIYRIWASTTEIWFYLNEIEIYREK